MLQKLHILATMCTTHVLQKATKGTSQNYRS